jgi:mannosyltransferase OCH1-like enzyme
VRKQMRRTFPASIACILLLLIFTQIDHFERYQHKSGDVLKRILAYQTSFQNHNAKDTKFPKKIWQTWKVDPLEFDERDSKRARTWTKTNPEYRYEVLTDGNDLDYVEIHFGPDGINRPDIVETYRTLNATIIKADFLRYLVMYVEGGVYADIDVSALRPINTWIPDSFREGDVDLIISVEIDEPTYSSHRVLGPKSQSFCQWTFMCKPRLPVMMRLIEHVMHWLNEISQKQQVPISQITLNFDEVITGTGPSAFTASILAEMTAQTHRRIYWDTFSNLTQPVLVGNILVLTVKAFAAGQGHSNSGTHEDEAALVQHHYHASLWPSRHPRYSHPAYGMVEECNWARDCVEDWDKNTAAFDFLPADQQAKLIAEKEFADATKYDKEMAEKKAVEKQEADKKEAALKEACRSISYIPSFQSESSQQQATDASVISTSTETAATEEATQLPPVLAYGT